MQIDGHHTLTYIAARLAGFTHADAAIVAHSAQYVDDATNGGSIRFRNKAMYNRISSAHKMLDYRNSDELANHRVWIPFHFLPGNGGKAAGENPDGKFIHKLVCRPDSQVARDMLRACAQDQDQAKPYALHRLGITMHTYADTWAHQGFAGINHKINEVDDLSSSDSDGDKGFFDTIANFFLSKSFPLGHGAALSYPDRPWLQWQYTNGLGENIERDNTAIFMDAIDKMCRAMQCFIANDLEMNLEAQSGLPAQDAATLQSLLQSITHEDGEDRHGQWLEQIKSGAFSFGPQELSYTAKGKGSWKEQALGSMAKYDTGKEKFPLREEFMGSHWKHFHDALQAHRLQVLHDILPRYGICAA